MPEGKLKNEYPQECWVCGEKFNAECPYKGEEDLRHLYHDEDLTLREIGDRLGTNDTTVLYWMDKFGIDRRKPGPQDTQPPRLFNDKRGYVGWSVKTTEGQRLIYVHRLLAVAEYGFNEIENNDVHHKNGIKWDNRPSNIDVLPTEEHLKLHALNKTEEERRLLGRRAGRTRSNLSIQDVREIKQSLKEGVSQVEIAEEYGVSGRTISDINTGRTYTEVESC